MYISALSLSAILLTLIPLSTVCALPANPSNELHPRKSITYYAIVDFFDKPTCSNVEQGRWTAIPDQDCIKLKPRSMFMYIGWSESFSRLSLYSDDNCGTEVKFFEQGANGQHDACTNLSGVGTVLSMKNTSKK